MEIPDELASMLNGEHGPTKQKAARLVVDLAATASATKFIRCDNSHVSGVSVITGGHGLRRFLSDLSGDPQGKVVIPTTLNSAGCDLEKIEDMDIDYPDFLKYQFEIVQAYSEMGINATLSCTPYDQGIDSGNGFGSWAESNAVCFSNSYTSLITNRESGLSAIATSLTGWAPYWGLHIQKNRIPNILVKVKCDMSDTTDWSILGDWIGKQIRPDWNLPWGPMPHITGLPKMISFEMRKALTAAAANYGCPMLWIEGHTTSPESNNYQGEIVFDKSELSDRYLELNSSEPLKAYSILFNVQKKGIKAPLQVYRALDKLVEIGKIHKIESRNAFIACQNSSCQISKATAFSICESCEKVSEISNSKLSKYLSNFVDKSGMEYSKYNLEFFGLCKKCKVK